MFVGRVGGPGVKEENEHLLKTFTKCRHSPDALPKGSYSILRTTDEMYIVIPFKK